MSLKINNEKEFNELFNLYYEELCRIVLPVLNDKDAAEDAVQDVFVKLWIRREELEIKTSFKAYLYKAAILRGLDHLRKQKSTRKVVTELKIVSPASNNTTDETLGEKELSSVINTGLQKMPENMRAIFQLSRFSGLKNREIAEELGISIKTVESNMGRALKLMHEHLAPFLNTGACMFVYWLSEDFNYLIG